MKAKILITALCLSFMMAYSNIYASNYGGDQTVFHNGIKKPKPRKKKKSGTRTKTFKPKKSAFKKHSMNMKKNHGLKKHRNKDKGDKADKW